MSDTIEEIEALVVMYTELYAQAKQKSGWKDQQKQFKKLRDAARLIADDHSINWKKL